MTNVITILGATWASSHAHPRWNTACEHAYDMVRGASIHTAQRDGASVVLRPEEITMIEAHEVIVVHGKSAMRWSTFGHFANGSIVRYDVLDDLPGDEAQPSVRVGVTRPTPAP